MWALLVTAGAFAALLGLVVDGGELLNDRLAAARTADQAARAGADALSDGSVRNGADIINAHRAADAVHTYLRESGLRGVVRVTGDTVTVTVTSATHTRILSVIGVDSFPITEDATARGITGSERP